MNPNRFLLPGGFGASSSGNGQSSGGSAGSGNFLFDIIRVSIKHDRMSIIDENRRKFKNVWKMF